MKAKSRPNIGVTAATERVSYGVWKEIPAIISPARYLQAVQRAGGRPVLLPPDPEDAEDLPAHGEAVQARFPQRAVVFGPVDNILQWRRVDVAAPPLRIGVAIDQAGAFRANTEALLRRLAARRLMRSPDSG